MGSKLIELV